MRWGCLGIMEYKGVVLITGASSGIGECLADTLANEGYRVVATMRKPIHNTDSQSKIIKRLDVNQPASINQCIEEVIRTYGRIDILINNAGYAEGSYVEEANIESWQAQLETNLFGSIRVTQAVLPFMRKQKSGTIIFLGSISGRYAFPGFAPYATSKFALEALAESLRHEVKPFNIHSVIVELGAIKTAIWNKGLAAQVKQQQPQIQSPYREEQAKLRHFVQKSAEHAESPERVAQLILKIIRKKRPKLRYALGLRLKLLFLAKTILPWAWIEKMIARSLHKG